MSYGTGLSLVVPAYNEEEVLDFSIPQLLKAFEDAKLPLELVVVDNGSSDRTPEIIQAWSDRDERVVPARVEVNQGIGFGIHAGMAVATRAWVGYIPADGQVDAEDVARLFAAAAATNGRLVAKVRRHYRVDGWKRRIVSVSYQAFFRGLFPAVSSLDINGTPKLIPRPAWDAMNLESTEWLLDPEIMVKSSVLDMRVMEFNVFGRMRGGGVSQVRASTMQEFLSTLVNVRISKRWRQQVDVERYERAMIEWATQHAFLSARTL